MRLAVFTNQFPGPLSTYFARDMRGLLEAGIEVDIFPFYPLDPTLWRYVPSVLDENVLPRNRVHHIGLGQSLRYIKPFPLRKFGRFLKDTTSIVVSAIRYGIRPLAKNLYVLPKAWAWAQLYPNNYDHILAYWGNYAATCAYTFSHLTASRTPFSLFLHADIDLYHASGNMREKLLYADNIITCCDFNIQFIQDRFLDIFHLIAEKLHVHHHGLDFSVFQYTPDGRQPQKIIAVGRFEKKKGFDYLLRAMHELKCRNIKAELELVGDGAQRDALRALALELGIMERVKFPGWLTSDEVQTAMKQAAILVHPSPEVGDGVPNVIKESMAVGTPVIASNVAGIPELLDNGRHGILAPPKDVTALANAIGLLLANDTLRRQYADAARRYAEKKFDLRRNGQRLADFLSSKKRSHWALAIPKTLQPK